GPVATFQGPSDVPFGDDRFAVFVTVADLNRDRRPDLVVIDHRGQASVLLGGGDGSFQAPLPVAGELLSSAAVADVNGGGVPDLVTADHDVEGGPGSASLLLGNGNGTFGDPQLVADGLTADPPVVADVNGDGRPDLVTASAGQLIVQLNDGNGSF